MTEQNITKPHTTKDKDLLVKENMGFVIAMAKQYVNKGVPLEDLISEGYIGLIKAAGKYDSTKGAKFTSYAANYIRNGILQALNMDNCKYNDHASTKLESMADKEYGTDNRAEQTIVNSDLVAAINILNERERMVISYCFGINQPQMTFAEIGKQLGISRERVRQIRKKAIRHLRKNNKAQYNETNTNLQK